MPTNPNQSSKPSGGGNKAKEIINKITEPIKTGAKKFTDGTKKFGNRVASFSKETWSNVSNSVSSTFAKAVRRDKSKHLMLETKGVKPPKPEKVKAPKPAKAPKAAPKRPATPEYMKPIPTEKWMRQLEDVRAFFRARALKYDFESCLASAIDSGYAATHPEITDKKELVKQYISSPEGIANNDIEFIGKKAWLTSAKKNRMDAFRARIQALMETQDYLRPSAFWTPELISKTWVIQEGYKRERFEQERHEEERRRQEELIKESREQNEKLREELQEQRKMFEQLMAKLDDKPVSTSAKSASTKKSQ